MNRRNFLKTSAVSSAALALGTGSLVSSCAAKPAEEAKKPDTKLNISFQTGTAPGEDLSQKLDFMEGLGIVGLEPGGHDLAERVEEYRKALTGRNIKISAICAGFDGFILAEDPAVKAQFDETYRRILEAAGELGSTGVIMVPAFNGQKPCRPHTLETRQWLTEQLHELGEFALKCGTTVILEPLNRGEAFFLRQVSDAAALCREADSKGVKCMGDFWHMKEETSDYAAFISAGEYLQHVHIASRGERKTPGEDGALDNYVDGFRALKEMNYPYYVSFECGLRSEDRAATVTAAVELIRKQWEMA
ncbi:MAG: TIM barrel protein [Alistipes sp.]|nr:TIM barrel protein [Candidatus Minthomonas equi]